LHLNYIFPMVQKLDILEAFCKKYGNLVTKDLACLRVCAEAKECYLEIELASAPGKVIKENLSLLVEDFCNIECIGDTVVAEEYLFDYANDIVDNATTFLYGVWDVHMLDNFELLFPDKNRSKVIAEINRIQLGHD
jgi:hypothetical protein